MHIAAIVVSIILAFALLGSGVQKLRRAPAIATQLGTLGVTPPMLTGLGALEVAAAFGLVIGIWWLPLAIAAAAGSVIYFIGAIVAHLRKADRQLAPAAVLLVISVAALVLLILSA